MKKFAFFLAALMFISLAACAQSPSVSPSPSPETTEAAQEDVQGAVMMQGSILEMTENGFIIETAENGEVQVLVSDETVLDADADVQVGDYVYIDHDGTMTASIPAQVSASVVRMHRLEGEISEVYAEENAVLLSTQTNGDVYVRLTDEWNGAQIDFSYMTVYFDGVMTMSMPGQINAGMVIPGYSVQGAISEIGAETLLIGDGTRQIEVHFSQGQLPETAGIGAVVRVIYDGQMTKSIPAQISATQIVQLSR